MLRAAAADARQVLGDSHLFTLVNEARAARVALDSGAGSEPLRAVVARMELTLGAAHPQTVKYAKIVACEQ